MQDIGKALLPLPATSKALPAPADSAEAAPLHKAEAVAEAAPEISPVEAKQEVKAESSPAISRPLSPYPSVILNSMIISDHVLVVKFDHVFVDCQ